MEASGAQLDFRAFIPPPVPDGQNFGATPFFAFLFESKGNRHDWQDDFSAASRLVRGGNKARRQLVDLVAWEKVLAAIQTGQSNGQQKVKSGNRDPESRAKAAPGVLDALKPGDAVFEELRAASLRPYSRYPIKYNLEDPWGILMPHLEPIKAVAPRLRLRACAALAAGQNQNALQDVKLMLYLADSLKEEPMVISYIVRAACLQIAIQPVWEALAERRWSDGQLQELQTHFQRYDFLADLKLPVEAERAAGALTADLLYRQKYRLSDLLDQSGTIPFGISFANLLGRIAPHGWYYQEQLNFCRVYERQLGGTFDAKRRRVFPGEIEVRQHDLEREIAGGRLGKTFSAVLYHHLLAAMLVPALNRLPLQAAMAQTAADQAALACALERYRLANGQFPEKLETLVPRYFTGLPRDLLSGDSYKYRRTDQGQFVLYSIGWNEKDDGGIPGTTLFDEKQGDWVWEYQ
jgi:hypothetical protein